jgi:hypothetical protein
MFAQLPLACAAAGAIIRNFGEAECARWSVFFSIEALVAIRTLRTSGTARCYPPPGAPMIPRP